MAQLLDSESKITPEFYDRERKEVFEELKNYDNLLFNLAFNECDTSQLRNIIHDDFEFYHDQAGVNESKDDFIKGIIGLCQMTYKPTRELSEKSLEVYLLKHQGRIYGALQKGKHSFYAIEKDKPRYLTSTALFTHLWVIDNGDWKLKRVLSYDHQAPK